MKPRLWTLLGLLICTACGGQSNGHPGIASEGSEAGDGGRSGAPDDSLDRAGTATSEPEAGGASSSHAGAASGGSESDAGAPGYIPFIDSGTRWCENSDYCFGLDCYAPPTFDPAVCVAPCRSDADCSPYEACVQSSGLQPTCYARCESPSDCAFHFDCFDYSGVGPFVCFPATWASRRPELGK